MTLQCNRYQKENPPFGGWVQKLYSPLSSASISRDRFRSPSRYCGVNTSFFDSCSSLDTTDKRELFKSVSILWTLLRSRVKSSIAIVAFLSKGGLWLGLRSRYNADVARFFFKGSFNPWQGKSELPKNSTICPINRRKSGVIGQSRPTLRQILNLCPPDVRVAAWCKSFCAFKRGVRPAYAWEPVIYRGGRNPVNGHRVVIPEKNGKQTTPKDFIVEPITLKKGLVGAKPEKVCRWILALLNVQAGDEVVDLFPGTGVMGRVANEITGVENLSEK